MVRLFPEKAKGSEFRGLKCTNLVRFEEEKHGARDVTRASFGVPMETLPASPHSNSGHEHRLAGLRRTREGSTLCVSEPVTQGGEDGARTQGGPSDSVGARVLL